MTAGRDRFEAEMRRARNSVKLAVVVEGNLADVLRLADERGRPDAGCQHHWHAGSVDAPLRRGLSVFCGSPRLACDFAVRYLTQPFKEATETARGIERAAKAIKKAEAVTP